MSRTLPSRLWVTRTTLASHDRRRDVSAETRVPSSSSERPPLLPHSSVRGSMCSTTWYRCARVPLTGAVLARNGRPPHSHSVVTVASFDSTTVLPAAPLTSWLLVTTDESASLVLFAA